MMKSPKVEDKKIRFRVKIIAAKNLAAKDKNGLSDRYAVLNIGKHQHETLVISKTLNPVWNAVFDFSLRPKEINGNELHITLWDRDWIGRDFIGSYQVSMESFGDFPSDHLYEAAAGEAGPRMPADNDPNWQLVQNSESGEKASINFVAGFLTDNSDTDEWELVDNAIDTIRTTSTPDLVKRDSIATLNDRQVLGVLLLEIIEASNLPKEKALLRVTYESDPFVVISIGKRTFKTRVVRHSLNPVWREKLYIPIHDDELYFVIFFSIYDHDRFSFNDHICKTSISVNHFTDKPHEMKEESLPLEYQKQVGTDRSILKVQGTFIPTVELHARFWRALSSQYDHDDNGMLNKIEILTMLESIGSTLSTETIGKMFNYGDSDEIPLEEFIQAMEKMTISADPDDDEQESVILLRRCPLCRKKWSRTDCQQTDILTHLAICTSMEPDKVDRFVMGGFLTEEYASRKWFSKVFSFLSFGGYNVGKNNGIILIQDRETGKLIEERMPTFIRLGVRLLYQTTPSKRAVASRVVKQVLKRMTYLQGRRFDNPSSAKNIHGFILFHKLPTNEILEPLSSFKTFNEFFYRKLKPGCRPVDSHDDPSIIVSAADCRLGCFETITQSTDLWIKGRKFTIERLLQDCAMSDYYENGSLAVFRLAPQDYHRFHCPVDGVIGPSVKVSGSYFTVNPMAIRQNYDVYTENVRVVTYIDTKLYGRVAYVAIGAMMVGSVIMTCEEGQAVKKGDELGYFAFGGSTIITVFPRGVVQYDKDLLRNSHEQLETLVKMGNHIGTAVRSQIDDRIVPPLEPRTVTPNDSAPSSPRSVRASSSSRLSRSFSDTDLGNFPKVKQSRAKMLLKALSRSKSSNLDESTK